MITIATRRDAGSDHYHGFLHVADVARGADVTPATVRYYARIGLLNPGRDHHNGYRRFTRKDLRRVVFVRKAQALGLTISDVRAILERSDRGEPVCDLVIRLVHERLESIKHQLVDLDAVKRRIERALDQWSEAPTGDRSSDLCPLIERTAVDGPIPETGGDASFHFNAISR